MAAEIPSRELGSAMGGSLAWFHPISPGADAGRRTSWITSTLRAARECLMAVPSMPEAPDKAILDDEVFIFTRLMAVSLPQTE
jgi:hypothetical protein